MPSLADHHATSLVKLLLVGDAKSGKTGSLVSLVKAGYKLRILDFDNLLDILSTLVRRICPENIGNVEFYTLRDNLRSSDMGVMVNGMPKAFVQGTKMLDRWKYDDVDLGVPAEWGSDTVLVVDSLSRLCDAAYDWRAAIAPKSKSGGEMDGRAVYGDAQDAVEKLLALLTSKRFGCNVIVIAHGIYMNLPDGTTKIFPQGVGQKLSPKIPSYFPSVVYYTKRGEERTIRTKSTALIDLATGGADVSPEYPVETGLAQIFAALKLQPAQETQSNAPSSTPSPLRTLRKL